MIASLAPHVHMAWIGRDIVTLETEADRYTCLVGASDFVAQIDETTVEILNRQVFEDLTIAGLIGSDPPPPRKRFTPPNGQIHPGRIDPVGALIALARAVTLSRRYHQQSFRQLTAAHHIARPLATPPSEADLANILASHKAALPWVPRQEACLHRSYLLHGHLAAHGIASDWVFGVRTWPFLAHCWLQVGDAVIGDLLERVRRYTPILVI